MLLNDTDFINLPLFIKGKVRNVYDLGDKLLIVVTDRISAFDVVFSNLIPNKGKVLNRIAEFWFEYTKDIIGNHIITSEGVSLTISQWSRKIGVAPGTIYQRIKRGNPLNQILAQI